jgi:hypothetical protein
VPTLVAAEAIGSASPVLRSPQHGIGWDRVARAVSDVVSPETIEGIWLFSPVRLEDREWGTAVVACRQTDTRQRVFTASYLVIVRGRDRGRGKVTVEEVGTSPPNVLDEVLQGVQERAGEPEPPVAVPRETWYPEPTPVAEPDATLDPYDPPDLGAPSIGE